MNTDPHRRQTNTLPAPEVAEALKTLTALIDAQAVEFVAMADAQRTMRIELDTLQSEVCGALEAVLQDVHRLRDWIGADSDDGPFYPEFKALKEQLEDITAKVEGRNKSAPTKRNMTDADALKVLTGDLKDLSHKDAAEKAGLTYAQVYSCRGGFTFKHVIHELEKTGWKNLWEKSTTKKA